MTLTLNKAIAVIDLETTGTDIETARVVSFGIVCIGIDGKVGPSEEFFVNPGVTIPPEATAIHGITDEMVKGSPTFQERAEGILHKLNNCDLAGYNVEKSCDGAIFLIGRQKIATRRTLIFFSFSLLRHAVLRISRIPQKPSGFRFQSISSPYCGIAGREVIMWTSCLVRNTISTCSTWTKTT